jgi:hypothetical protein
MKRLAIIVLVLSCSSDPVTSGQIDALPGENPNAPIGEFHRAGQPCVLCHDPTGPASNSPFSVAGTVFAQPQNAVGVDQATVAMTDASGSSFTVTTNCVGNFFVRRPGSGDGGPTWDPEFPIFVRVFKNGLARTMQGQIGRERSCANCHTDPNPTLFPLQVYSSAGHIHLYLQGDSPPPPSSTCPVNPVLQ